MRNRRSLPERQFVKVPVTRLIAWALVLAIHAPVARAQPAAAESVLEITKDTQLDPQKRYSRIVIKTSNITLDGQGARLMGATEGQPKAFQGTAIVAERVSNVTIKNIKAKGWETGLRVTDGEGFVIENCDFSDNFHDPDFGWGENGRRGGIVLERVQKSTLRKNKANRVWDACVLVESDGNTIENCDFSRTSNTCLKLWRSSRNVVKKNNLSYGIRISPNEVHARDSTCVLIETASNDNRFEENDCTHGGDGIFIRVLNNVVSSGNVFVKNDCSHANNNGFEAWAPRNKYVNNTANFCSYGFWLGASDQTVLIGNEASHNGTPQGSHNSPHLPDSGHAGIVFMFGPSSHTIARGNTCIGNNGAGIALIGDLESKGEKWNAHHWIIEQNSLSENRWGIFAQNADWIDLAANNFRDNRIANLHAAENVTHLIEHPDNDSITEPPIAKLSGPSSAKVGEPVAFDASASNDPANQSLTFQWRLGDGVASSAPRVEHRFAAPGFYRVGLTVNNGLLSDLAWRDFYVVDTTNELGTEGNAERWTFEDPLSRVTFADSKTERLVGQSSLFAHVRPYGGFRVTLIHSLPNDDLRLSDKKTLTVWIKAEAEAAWQDGNPQVTLFETSDKFLRLTPKSEMLSQAGGTEAREGWRHLVVPLAPNEQWHRAGQDVTHVRRIGLGFDTWDAPPLKLWIDGLEIK